MNSEPEKRKNTSARQFWEDRGFYLVLILCVVAIGVAGYVFFFADAGENQTVAYTTAGDLSEVLEPWATGDLPALTTTAGLEPAATTEADVPAIATTAASAHTTAPAATTAKPHSTTAKSSKPSFYVSPVPGEILAVFSGDELVYDRTMSDWRTHNGVDFACTNGDKVFAVADGTIQDIYTDEYYGTSVLLNHGGGLQSIYTGLAADPAVTIGETVTAGDIIGTVDSSVLFESALPAHLHLEMLQDGVRIDPMSILPSD
ncbi:MAG: M23 family metallopeptidase [Clostridiaceae bacterium]|nr:M23 family metallopeptidase [Clostridiaceae bacterium]